jgi:hypothetical protein
MDKQKLLNDFKNKFVGSTKPAQTKVYTGTEMIGIATLHKSNAQPVFNTETAKDISNMRR